MSIVEQIVQAERELEPLLKKVTFNAVVNIMTNHVRNQWARAGYPGLRAKDPTGPARFISPPLLLQKLTGADK